MDTNAAIIETIKWLIVTFGASFLTWTLSRRKERADITNLITTAAGELVEGLRQDVKDLRERLSEQDSRICEVETESRALLAILRRWAAGIQKNANYAESNGIKLPWFPDAEDLKMVE